MTEKLRLGPLPKNEIVKMTITVSSTLKAEIDRYAALHAETWGEPVDAAVLIPHMVKAFMERDRGFKKACDKKNSVRTSSRSEVAKIDLPSLQS